MIPGVSGGIAREVAGERSPEEMAAKWPGKWSRKCHEKHMGQCPGKGTCVCAHVRNYEVEPGMEHGDRPRCTRTHVMYVAPAGRPPADGGGGKMSFTERSHSGPDFTRGGFCLLNPQ